MAFTKACSYEVLFQADLIRIFEEVVLADKQKMLKVANRECY